MRNLVPTIHQLNCSGPVCMYSSTRTVNLYLRGKQLYQLEYIASVQFLLLLVLQISFIFKVTSVSTFPFLPLPMTCFIHLQYSQILLSHSDLFYGIPPNLLNDFSSPSPSSSSLSPSSFLFLRARGAGVQRERENQENLKQALRPKRGSISKILRS